MLHQRLLYLQITVVLLNALCLYSSSSFLLLQFGWLPTWNTRAGIVITK